MLQIIIPALEKYDEIKEEFIATKEQSLTLEHSLVSISKWESKWCKPFLGKNERTVEETIDYIRCMTITQNVPKDVYNNITTDNINSIGKYIDSPMTATWFRKERGLTSNEIITSEIIYNWMIIYTIPFECQKWHLNRLLTLIRVCDKKNAPNKKMSNSEIMANNTKLNNERRERYNSKG